MNNPNFGAILDTPATDIAPPKPLPVGSYVCLVMGLPKMDKSTRKQTEFVEFTLKYMSALDDVDEEALDDALTKPSGEQTALTEKTTKITFYLTENAIWRLKKFLEDDLQIEAEDRTLRQMIDDAPGRQVLIALRHGAADSGLPFAEIASTAAVS